MREPLREYPTKRPIFYGEINVEGSLWALIPKAAVGIIVSVVIILLGFLLSFGEIPLFAGGFSIFIAALQVLTIVGLRFLRRDETHTTVKPRNDWIDRVGSFWLMACGFGAFLGWISGVLGETFPDFWRMFNVLKVIFTIVLPVTTMLPNTRYISRNAAFVQVPILVLVTLLPVLVGISAVFALLTNSRP